VALNVALEAFAGIDTEAGTVRLPVADSATDIEAGAGALNVAVQEATPAGARVDGLQLIPLRTDEELILVAVPPVALTTWASPAAEEACWPEIPMAAEPADDIVTATVATTPLPIRLLLMPVAVQL
jgi:hypothetical protein